MKPKNIERRRAVRAVLLNALLQLLTAVLLLRVRSWFQTGWLRGLMLFLAMSDLITIPFTFAALWQRVREIEKGELEEAKKY